ncbi:uncharacterized protein LOC130748227 isoform X2 [Lotus japonicus]|uniref:uncharacterized protein LOC130748227 isoform X2 n=1 Tax=Lotus japonicus TaxID=34305 RepID=UPI002588BE36|nr:uncharacterized protein LOC130748227 isoform X2 [Lotus japonicus]
MRDYDDDGMEYEDYYEDEYGEEEEEEEEEAEERRKPTKEEMEYLEFREKLKEQKRKEMKMESGGTSRSGSDDRMKSKLPNDNYGSFFGPSQPVIAQRVLQEKKSLSENQHLASRISNPLHTKKNQNKVSNGGSKSSSHNPPPKVSEVKGKSQKLKDTRDYSFLLSDDAELPAPSKAPPPRDMPIQNSEGRPAQVPLRSKQPSSNGGRLFHVSHEDRKQGSVAGHLPHKSGSTYRPSSTSKPSTTSADSRKQLGNNSGNGPGRPVGPKGLPPKIPVRNTGNKSSTPGIKNPVNGVHKSVPSKAHSSIPKQSVVPSKAHSSIPKQSVEQRRDTREPNKPKMIPKQPVASSKSQISKPLKQIPMHSASQNHRPKNKVPRQHLDDVEPEMDYRRMIRSIYNPENCADDDDDDNMEAGFEEIMREERRSAKIARREDEEQLRLIEEEEKRMRRKRLAKNR